MEEDFFSNLPDDILVSILSLLSLKETARTSILSHRWMNLWKFTSRLDFDNSQLVMGSSMHWWANPLEVQWSRFGNWVNNVLKKHQGTSIDEFTVCFYVNENSSKCNIDSWINFALQKRVRKLRLDFTSLKRQFEYGSYILTTQFLASYNLNSLVVLHLNGVEVTGKVVEYILSHCPLLEVLSVTTSKSLVHLKVSSPSLKLKCLEIRLCSSLKYIEISATSLMSFKYSGQKIRILVNNLPHLVEASIEGWYACFLVENVCHFKRYLSKLQTLLLDLKLEGFRRFPKIPKLKNLKELELLLSAHAIKNLIYCDSLLKASPLLHRFILKIFGLRSFNSHKKANERGVGRIHPCVKVIELCGFYGCGLDFELVLHLLKRAVSLEKLVIDTCCVDFQGRKFDCRDLKQKLAVKTRAKQLKTRLPPGAELVIF
ncbi:F-box/LRR-repeat protein At2g42730-like isoform X2 [Malania oleifera]|nr:F-box/LRR-repeat protein At2g42730-like isoform X2 [Malania oleifera]XP_057984305.1 F-box/LRR-repeat protein At2g42730-like isoform X2 [Malania oleifera]